MRAMKKNNYWLVAITIVQFGVLFMLLYLGDKVSALVMTVFTIFFLPLLYQYLKITVVQKEQDKLLKRKNRRQIQTMIRQERQIDPQQTDTELHDIVLKRLDSFTLYF